jgi:hypothetical protein
MLREPKVDEASPTYQTSLVGDSSTSLRYAQNDIAIDHNMNDLG